MHISTFFPDDDVLRLASEFVKSQHTLRSLEKTCSYSKTTLHVAFTKRLQLLDSDLYNQVQSLLENNWNARYRRGGLAVWAKKRS